MSYKTLLFSMCISLSATVSGMEQVTKLLYRMHFKDHQVLPLNTPIIRLFDKDWRAVAINPEVAALSPTLAKRMLKVDSPGAIIQYRFIAFEELKTIAQVLEVMDEHKTALGVTDLNNDIQKPDEQAIRRWQSILEKYVFPFGEYLTVGSTETHRLGERYEAARKFQLPLVQKIIQCVCRNEIAARRNPFCKIPPEIWSTHIAPYLMNQGDLQELKIKILAKLADVFTTVVGIESEHPVKTINCLAAAQSVGRFYSGHVEGVIKGWQIFQNTVKSGLEIKNAHEITSLAFSPNGKYAAVGTKEAELTVWDGTLSTQLKTIGQGAEGFGCSIIALAFSADNTRLLGISGHKGHSGNAMIWDTATWQPVTQINNVLEACFSSDGTWLAAVIKTDKTRIIILDSKIAKEIKGLGDFFQPQWVTCSPDGKWLAAVVTTYGSCQQLCVWDTTNWKSIFNMVILFTLNGIAFSPDGKFLATTTSGFIEMHRVGSWQERIMIENTAPSSMIIFSSDGHQIIQDVMNPKVDHEINLGVAVMYVNHFLAGHHSLETLPFRHYLLFYAIALMHKKGKPYALTATDQKLFEEFGKNLNPLVGKALRAQLEKYVTHAEQKSKR